MSLLDSFKVISLVQSVGDSIVTFEQKRIKFNRVTAEEMQYARKVRMLIDAANKRFAIQECDESDENGINFASEPGKQKYFITMHKHIVLSTVRNLMGWDSQEDYKIPGIYYPEAKAMIYDLNKATPVDHRTFKNNVDE